MNKKYTLNYTGKFKNDLKLCKKRGFNISLFEKEYIIKRSGGTFGYIFGVRDE